MSETLITLGIIAAMFAWPPVLQAVCPACSRLLRRYRSRFVPAQMDARDQEPT